MGTEPHNRTASLVLGWAAGIFGTLVISTPFIVSFQSLREWAIASLGIHPEWAWTIPLALDMTGVTFMLLTSHAVVRGDSGGASRFLVWVMVAASAGANARHGSDISTDATITFAAMPVIGGLLLEVFWKRLRRSALVTIDAVERPIAHYRFARWAVAPRETFRAWKVSVREGITSPHRALAVSRQLDGDETAEVAAAHARRMTEIDELSKMSKTAALEAAFVALDEINVPAAMTWLAQRDITVSPTHAHKVARDVAARPAVEGAEVRQLAAAADSAV